MHKRLVVAPLVAAIAASGCSTVSNEGIGTAVGGALGGILGSRVGKGSGKTAAIIVGSVAGAVIGGQIGRSMDASDQSEAQHALETQRTGDPYAWTNPDTDARYEVTPTRTYEAKSGYCREYTLDAAVEGREETTRGTACRQPDGTWRTM
jgi:surface antigen